jgi:hypothetical protein
MGIVFGFTGTKEPVYIVVQSYVASATRFEVRRNPNYFIAEVPMSNDQGNDNKAFGILAKYIGVFGKPENEASQSLAMTSPVIMQPKESRALAMTSPVIQTTETMSFVLPFDLKSLADVPVPKDARVQIREIPAKTIAVSKFSGWYSPHVGVKMFNKLVEALKEKGLLDQSTSDANIVWSVAQYHPPFTIPFFRRNEIWIEINEERVSAVAAALPDSI